MTKIEIAAQVLPKCIDIIERNSLFPGESVLDDIVIRRATDLALRYADSLLTPGWKRNKS